MHAEYAKRRAQLFEKLAVGSMAVLPAAEEQYRNGDVAYPFRQASDFYYLTGFSEPGAVLVLLKTAQAQKYILFCEPACPAKAIWIGESAGLEGAKAQFGADEAYALEALETQMPALLAGQHTIYYSLGQQMSWDRRLIKWAHPKDYASKRKRAGFVDLIGLISEARLIKSAAEIAWMRRAITVSVQAHVQLMQQCAAGRWEYELEALFAYACAKQGCRSLAYPSIVGGGVRACTLHYVNNDQPLKAGDLVLVDAGAEHQGYAADITRTFPVSGTFSADQSDLYNVVLEAQLAAIALIQPGTPWDALQAIIIQKLTAGLIALGILTEIKKLYPHGSGHWLGLDVHDVGAYKIGDTARALEAGMVLTVEPGLYIPVHCEGVDPRWWGIGIRIEDDVLVTETGHEVLSAALPKTIEAIESLMRTGGSHERC